MCLNTSRGSWSSAAGLKTLTKTTPNSNCFFGDSINKPTALIVINRQVLDSCTSQVCLIVWSSFMPGGTSLADWQVEVLIYNRKQLLSRLCWMPANHASTWSGARCSWSPPITKYLLFWKYIDIEHIELWVVDCHSIPETSRDAWNRLCSSISPRAFSMILWTWQVSSLDILELKRQGQLQGQRRI